MLSSVFQKGKHLILGILQNDIVSTLQSMQILKYWRGKHIILQPSDTNEWKERLKKFKLRCNQSKINRNLPTQNQIK